MTGFTGKILQVNLTTGECRDEPIPEHIYYNYLTGTGLAVRLLYERIPAGADPLGPDNILVFASGLLTGTGSLFTGRWMAAAKSPLTGTWGDANCGGNLSPAIKQCGYDAILVSGISEKPVFLRVDNKGGEILSAENLWGLDTVTTEERLATMARGKKKPAVACIGTAGEKLSLISGIVNHKGRIAARSGLGAVMGSKRLKAIVLEGSRPVRAADKTRMKELSNICRRKSRGLPLPKGKVIKSLGKLMGKMKLVPAMNGKLFASLYQKWGTSSLNQFSIEQGDAPIKNWYGSSVDFPPKLSNSTDPDRVGARQKQKYHCYACPMGCGGLCGMTFRSKEIETHKPEYESTVAFGGMLLNSDMDSIFFINELLNRAGMDTISAGGTVAFAMECFEKGLITSDQIDGIDLSWGNTQSIITVVEKMVKREGIGDLLADGAKSAARKLGGQSDTFAITAGGQELAMHDPRLDPGFGLHASVDPTPGRHTNGAQVYYELYALWKEVKSLSRVKPLILLKNRFIADKEKAVHAAAVSDFTAFYNGAGICMFGALCGVHRVPVFRWMNAATGWDRTPEDYMQTGRRIHTLKQLFNLKHGIDPADMKASPRSYGDPPLSDGPNKGRSFDLEKMMLDYWQEVGWGSDGRPTAKTIEKLGLAELVAGEEESGTPKPKTVQIKPAEPRTRFKGMKPVVDKKRCVSCTACIQDCPVDCLELTKIDDRDPDAYPTLPDPVKCISCAFCCDGCPVEAIRMV